MEPTPAKAFYTKEKEAQLAVLQVQKKRQNLLGWLRLGILVVAAFAAYQLFYVSVLWGWMAVVAGISFFLWVVSLDAANNDKIAHTKKLVQVNEDELKILSGDYYHFFDGSIYMPEVHNYANDLDVFGKASLYQYTNRCNTEQGRAWLAHNFLEPLPLADVVARQEAVKELAPQTHWRQQLQAFTMQATVTQKIERDVLTWLQQPEEHFVKPIWRVVVPIYCIVTVSTAVAAIAGVIPTAIFGILFFLYFVMGGALSKKATAAYNNLGGIVKEVGALSVMAKWIEEKEFSAPLLQKLQQSVRANGAPAYGQIKKLQSILDRFDMRLNVFVFIFLNSFLLWDVWQMMALNNWRKKNKSNVAAWFDMLAEVEVLHSLATLHFNQPAWAMPQFTDHYFTFSGRDVGHPLLPAAQRVTSDFTLTGTAKVALITGSNMAGKSTFLRSLGVNIVLAQMGAPVCARQLLLSPMQLMSSMRIADNLAENTSTFYAELKKLKTIIEAVKERIPVFVLLDEVLRGTNSLDRHTGSEALVKQFIKENAVAVIATHDVAISKLENEYPEAVQNYHFDVQVSGDELYFDYKLKQGVCTSLNASILMKKIGIEL